MKYNKEVKRSQWLWSLLGRYYKGMVNDRERQIVEDWKPTSEEDSELDQRIVDEQCEEIWYRLEHCLPEESIRKTKRWQLSVMLYRVAAVAASILLLVWGGIAYFLDRETPSLSNAWVAKENLQKEYVETTDSIRKETLPDGSVVCLNNNTRLAYIPGLFNHQLREVWLEEGEAFFEVRPDSCKAFIVYHGDLRTIVRGTSFNIRFYKDLSEDIVSVRSGKVEVRADSLLVGSLVRGEAISHERSSGNFKRTSCSDTEFMAWMNHRLVLHQANVAELSLRIEQLYQKELVIEGNAMRNMRLSVSFPSECSLENVMSVLSELYEVDYREDGNRLIIFKRPT